MQKRRGPTKRGKKSTSKIEAASNIPSHVEVGEGSDSLMME